MLITGCEQPGGLAVLSHECGLCMFMPETSPHDVNWKGPVAGVEATLETFKAEKAYPMRKIHEILPDMRGRSSKLFHSKEAAAQTFTDLKAFQKADYYDKVKNLSNLTDELQWIKSLVELKLMRESASIACQVIIIEPGLYIPSSFDGPERFRGIGIRIEDEVLITERSLRGQCRKKLNTFSPC